MAANRSPSKCRILIVDDDHVVLALMQDFLQGAGYPIEFAADALYATGLAIRQRPALVLLDIQLPGGNGLTVLKRLKSNTHTQNIPVIVVSASEDPTMSRQVTELGAAAYLSKPITRTDLLTVVDQVLNPQQG
jgi:CheY-like chemotaxis protein